MRKLLLLLACSVACADSFAVNKDSIFHYSLPDSVKVTSFYSALHVQTINKKFLQTGIGSNQVKLFLQKHKKAGTVVMSFPEDAIVVANGIDVHAKGKKTIVWQYDWKQATAYNLMMVTASDSAGNFMLYSGYIYLPEFSKWKLLGCVRINGQHGYLNNIFHFSAGKKNAMPASFSKQFVQRTSGSWKNMTGDTASLSTINLLSHVDSIRQYQAEREYIQQAIAAGKTDANKETDGIYYSIMKQGDGRAVRLTDTVEVYYKGYLLKDSSVFDQTAEKPARFPLNRLIKGWQIGVPLINAGGKIKLVIPSALAYSIRTRSPKIPPNSILVFEVEVVASTAGNQVK